ncbi:MAG: flagellinolysin [Gammaproteobacteria bacterium]|nr:flagellinolysin [Gammaproteobacteria bacterium]
MKIASNLSGLMLDRIYNNNARSMSVTTTRLASGLRINSARDDAAGLAISTRFTSQIRGMRVGQRNLNDAVSMLQVADGGLSEVNGMLQRMRELSLRAANTATVSVGDRRNLQLEVDQLTMEIQSTFNKTEFNGIHLLTPLVEGTIAVSVGEPQDDLLYALKATWMQEAENAVSTWYGITANLNEPLEVVFDDTGSIGPEGAKITATYDAPSRLGTGLTLTLDMNMFGGAQIPNGGGGPLYLDRIIAREMTKAVMHRNVDMAALPEWFKEGAGELLIGGDERVAADGGVNVVKTEDLTAWADTSAMRSKSYLAQRYINDVLISNSASMDQLFTELNNTMMTHGSRYLYDAINSVAGLTGPARYNNESQFMSKLNAYINTNYLGLDLANAEDVGAIGGLEAGGAPLRADTSAEGVIPDIEGFQENPTLFDVTFPVVASAATTTSGTRRSLGQLHYMFQYGANPGDAMQVDLKQFSTSLLHLRNLDVVKRAQEAVTLIDTALDTVNSQRARYGAQLNRVEHMLAQLETNHESYSRSRSAIEDADYAVEMSSLLKTKLLDNAATSMMAQSNTTGNLVLSLLNSSFG